MPVNYQHIQRQMADYAAKAQKWQLDLDALRDQGLNLLHLSADSQEQLTEKVLVAVQSNPNLRCGLPTSEKLDMVFPLPAGQALATIIAADGSQVIPSRHRQVEFGVINISTVTMRGGSGEAPAISVDSELLDLDLLHSEAEAASEGYIALLRDVAERGVLVREAGSHPMPVITLTDGGLELFREPRLTDAYSAKLQEYILVMRDLMTTGALTAAYVDKPGSSLVLNMLDIAAAPSDALGGLKRFQAFPDRLLFAALLTHPGERSSLFQIKSPAAQAFTGYLALHFFYLNVGRGADPFIVRVEVPGWVAEDNAKMNLLHASLVEQAWLLADPYPYALHRAHEEAVVTYEDSSRLEEMIIAELLKRGVKIGKKSFKQTHKDHAGRRRFGR